MYDDTHILSVSSLTRAIKGSLETAFPFVWVRGQVANLSRPSSGHVYFSLKDEECSLAAVWFKSSLQDCQRFNPLTGEVFEEGPRQSLASSLVNGQEIVCAGRIAVYGQRGQYQLVVELAQGAGFGRLHEEFARLKAALEALGFFASERKRRLPQHPRRLAVITAPKGAAIHDFLRIAEDRGLGAAIRIYPAPMQGDGAPPAIITALRRIWNEDWAECIVLIRGGGSIEDLWAFNDEALARAVHASPIPILAGIGHEVDFTLVDMTADARAATPSHAAQLLWPGRKELLREWQQLVTALEQTEERWLAWQQDRLERLLRGLMWGSPERRIAACSERLTSNLRLLTGAGRLLLEKHGARLAALHSRLEAMDPHAPLERGYALARKGDGTFVRLTNDVVPGETLRLVVSDGDIPIRVEGEK
jgi:exodeoxyribonuclease VII large subunit